MHRWQDPKGVLVCPSCLDPLDHSDSFDIQDTIVDEETGVSESWYKYECVGCGLSVHLWRADPPEE